MVLIGAIEDQLPHKLEVTAVDLEIVGVKKDTPYTNAYLFRISQNLSNANGNSNLLNPKVGV